MSDDIALVGVLLLIGIMGAQISALINQREPTVVIRNLYFPEPPMAPAIGYAGQRGYGVGGAMTRSYKYEGVGE